MTDTSTSNATTAVENADAIVEREINKMRPTQIYEQWVADHMDIIRFAANAAKITDFEAFKTRWGNKLGLDEIAHNSEDDIASTAEDAVREAARALYGEDSRQPVMADHQNARNTFWYNLEGDNFRVLKPQEHPARFTDTDEMDRQVNSAEWNTLPF